MTCRQYDSQTLQECSMVDLCANLKDLNTETVIVTTKKLLNVEIKWNYTHQSWRNTSIWDWNATECLLTMLRLNLFFKSLHKPCHKNPCNVISLKCNITNVTYHYTFIDCLCTTVYLVRIYLQCALLHQHIHHLHTWMWPIHGIYNDLIGHLNPSANQIPYEHISITSPSLIKTLQYTFYSLCMVHLKPFSHLLAINPHHHTLWFSGQVNMSLVFNNKHVIYYHMDALWSVGLVKTYFFTLVFWLSNDGSMPLIYPLTLVTKWDPRAKGMFSSLRIGGLYTSWHPM